MKHEILEKNVFLGGLAVLVVISFGTLVEVVPQVLNADATKPIEGLEPMPALALEGRDIYIREGCHVCHSQMIRPLRTETERYGHYSVAGEHVYEHPFLWGSKRTGPDLARVGGRYSDQWHTLHLINPQQVVPQSNMPPYPWLAENVLDGKSTATKMRALRKVGVPYTDETIAGAAKEVEGKSEIEALVVYLQQLGTLLPNKR